MVSQNNLTSAPGSRKARKVVGRGDSNGHGNFSGRGCKGQKSRAGGGPRPGFEGGQLPMIKRLPEKRGFTNIFRVEYAPVNIEQLNVFDADTEVTAEKLVAAGLIKSTKQPIKILADGELTRPLTVKAEKFSASAKAKIEAAGGKAEEVAHAAKAD
ncbi:MAG: 50S ribosomal protein L15 [Dehalococcoidales bacterium]|nr:50S ribosomal protein L15 [Dehalococcoidales bacterium]